MQETVSNLDTSGAGLTDLLNKWGSYSATDIYNQISSISNNISDNNSIPDVSQILNLTETNATDLQSLKNSALALQALTLANKSLLESGTAKPIIQTWLEQGSIIFKTLITNPSTITQTVPFKFYLPKEATESNIIKIDNGLNVGYDPTQDAYYVQGSVVLNPNQSHIYSVEVTDIWKIPSQQIESLRNQANQLFAPLKSTSFYAQGATLYSDIIASLDTATNLQAQAQTPDERIKAYRDALVYVNKSKSEITDLKNLDSSSSSNSNLLGFVGGVQVTAVWGLIIVLTAGFIFLAVYMRILITQTRKKDIDEKKKEYQDIGLLTKISKTFTNLKSRFSKKTFVLFGIITCFLIALLLACLILYPQLHSKKILVSSKTTIPTKNKINPVPKITSLKPVNELIVQNKTADYVNVRQGPGKNFPIINTAKVGLRLTQVGSKTDLSGDQWIEINSNGHTGWILGSYLTNVTDTSSLNNNQEISIKTETQVLGVSAKSSNQVMINVENTTGVNLRVGPSTHTAIITKILKNTIVYKINSVSGWSEVELNSTTNGSQNIKGWIYNKYITSL